MTSQTSRQFRQLFASLPRSVQRQARQSHRLFRRNSSHPGLRFKRVHDAPPIYSVRVGIGYRAVDVFDGEAITWFWIDSHAGYDRLLENL